MAVFNNILAGAAGQAGGATGYTIERSLRFNSADSSYLSFQPSSAGNRKTYTLSFWAKSSNHDDGVTQGFSGGQIFSAGTTGGGPRASIGFPGPVGGSNQDKFVVAHNATGSTWTTLSSDAVFRDFSAWQHFVVVVDCLEGTASNRVKVYVNGSQITMSGTYPNNENQVINNNVGHAIGRYNPEGRDYFNGYLADVHFIDGQALDSTDFGEFDDNGVWQPIEYTGTYGTNGFHLDFSDNSTAAALGTDTSGNGNDWTVNNITAAGNGTSYRSLEVIEPDPNGSVANIQALFNPTYIGNYINTSTWVITNTAWIGAYNTARDVLRWTPRGGYAVSSSLRVYFGAYSNVSRSTTLTVTYTDSSTESSSQFSSGINNWMTLFTTSNAAGKTIEKVELSIATPSATNLQFGAFVVDDQIVTSLNTDTDSFIDSPTNGTQTDTGAGGQVSGNYATLNPLVRLGDPNATFSDGNLTASFTSANNYAVATIGITSGKYYYELTASTGVSSSDAATYIRAFTANGVSETFYHWRANGGTSGLTGSPTFSTYASGDVLGVGIDATNSTVRFYKNGTLQGSGDYSYTTFSGKALFISAFANPGNRTCHWNFGQRAFAYSAPSGFKALCTANLDDPTIADGSTAMDVVTYDGTQVTRSITGLEFGPDLVWTKSRSNTTGHELYDSVRGAQELLYSDLTNGETTVTNGISSFNSDGWTMGNRSALNYLGRTYVAWTWDAGSSTVTNTDGSITSSVRANPSAGFSIVTYTGNLSSSGSETVGHGLGAAPGMVITKSRDSTGADTGNWAIQHSSLTSTHILRFDTAASSAKSGLTAPTSTVFTTTYTVGLNVTGNDYIAYCFAPVEGYSAFGSYTANGSTDGPFVYTGFRPSFLLYRYSSTTGNWAMFDSERNTYNVMDNYLLANTNGAEGSLSVIDFLSNGFKVRTAQTSGATIIYAAFAENPFKTARAR